METLVNSSMSETSIIQRNLPNWFHHMYETNDKTVFRILRCSLKIRALTFSDT